MWTEVIWRDLALGQDCHDYGRYAAWRLELVGIGSSGMIAKRQTVVTLLRRGTFSRQAFIDFADRKHSGCLTLPMCWWGVPAGGCSARVDEPVYWRPKFRDSGRPTQFEIRRRDQPGKGQCPGLRSVVRASVSRRQRQPG